MRIRVERSGGFAGIPISNEMDAKDLPSALLHTAEKIIENPTSGSLTLKKVPIGAADHYTYKISIKDGDRESVMEFNQYNMINDLKSLVKFIEKNSKMNRVKRIK